MIRFIISASPCTVGMSVWATLADMMAVASSPVPDFRRAVWVSRLG